MPVPSKDKSALPECQNSMDMSVCSTIILVCGIADGGRMYVQTTNKLSLYKQVDIIGAQLHIISPRAHFMYVCCACSLYQVAWD